MWPVSPNIKKLEAKRDVPGLIKLLGSEVDEYRLGTKRYFEALETRRQAAEALGRVRDRSAVDPLCALLHDGTVRDQAARALGEIGDPRAVEELCRVIEVCRWPCRAAIHALGKLRDGRAVIPLLNFVEARVRGCDDQGAELAVEALVRIGPPAVGPLCRKLADQSTELGVRKAVADMLGRIGDPAAVEPLSKVLAESCEPWVAEALERIGPPLDFAVQARLFIAKGDWTGLLELGQPAVPCLRDELKREGGDKVHLLETLARLGESNAVEDLVQVVVDFGYRADEAARALGSIGYSGACETLERALRNSPGGTYCSPDFDSGLVYVSQFIVEALCRFKYRPAVKTIIDYLAKLKRDHIWLEISENCFTARILAPLFGAYATIVSDLFSYRVKKSEEEKWGGHVTTYHYDLLWSDRALLMLCGINTPIATNLLHEVKSRADFHVTDWCAGQSVVEKRLSFEHQRALAAQELARRGFPPYDPTLYHADEAWAL